MHCGDCVKRKATSFSSWKLTSLLEPPNILDPSPHPPGPDHPPCGFQLPLQTSETFLKCFLLFRYHCCYLPAYSQKNKCYLNEFSQEQEFRKTTLAPRGGDSGSFRANGWFNFFYLRLLKMSSQANKSLLSRGGHFPSSSPETKVSPILPSLLTELRFLIPPRHSVSAVSQPCFLPLP